MGTEILSSIISVFSTKVAKRAAKIPTKPIFEPIKAQIKNIAKEPSQAFILLLYFKFLTTPDNPSPKDIKRAGITPNQKVLSKNQPMRIESPHIREKFTS